MKAEQEDNWKNLIEDPKFDFYISKPLSSSQFGGSQIKDAQNASLNTIIRILKNNPDLVPQTETRNGIEVPRHPHNLQVRFAVIPSPNCTLIINSTAICDSYLYAQMNERQLPYYFPICVINENDGDINKKIFQSITNHFKYLWQHDLTMFCGDATAFVYGPKDDNSNIDGLRDINMPLKANGKSNIQWKQKEKRINDKRKEIPDAGKTIITDSHIEKWKNNLNHKLELCTRKIEDSNASTNSIDKPIYMVDENEKPERVYVEVGHILDYKNNDVYYYRINFVFKNTSILCAKSSIRNVLWEALAHYGYAAKYAQEYRTSMHNLKKFSHLYRDIIKEIRTSTFGVANSDHLAESLFTLVQKKITKINVLPENITITLIKPLHTYTYKADKESALFPLT